MGRGGGELSVKSVFWFYLQIVSQIFLILRIIQRDIIINVHRSSCKVQGWAMKWEKSKGRLGSL